MSKPKYQCKFYDTEEFRKLQNKWYDKLQKSGFSDLEWLDKNSGKGQNSPFLTVSIEYLRKIHNLETETYFRLSRAFLHDYDFKTLHFYHLWKLHSEGLTYRQIIPKLNKIMKKKRSIFWISTHVNRLKKIMFKMYGINE